MTSTSEALEEHLVPVLSQGWIGLAVGAREVLDELAGEPKSLLGFGDVAFCVGEFLAGGGELFSERCLVCR